MCSSSEIGIDGLSICLDLFLEIVERFKGEFAMDGSDVSSLEEGVLVINKAHHGG